MYTWCVTVVYDLSIPDFLIAILMNKQFISAINQLCVEKNIPRDRVLDAVGGAIKTAYRKDYGTKDQELDITLDEETGLFTIYVLWNVVEEKENEETELTVAEAKKFKKDAKVGDVIRQEVTPMGFGRIAAQAAKQVILQRVQEAERDVLYETFKEREDELLNVVVGRVDKGQVYLEMDRNTVLFPREYRVQSERYHAGQRMRIYLEKVEKTIKGPQLVITRRSPKFVEKLFEFEIPEIKTKVIEIKGMAREPGVRTKVAVSSSDPKVDPIGACVGQRGSRITTIMDELMGEMIDVVQYDENPEKYIAHALAPAKIRVMELDHKSKTAEVYVDTDQRPLAIGRNGQNVRLASDLTGYEINLHDISEFEGEIQEDGTAISAETVKEQTATAEAIAAAELIETNAVVDDLDISAALKTKLKNAGVESVNVLRKMSVEDLTMIGGIGKASAEKIKSAAAQVA
ncbi:transcription termination/antitermination protein NusA [Candidatus Gracilibacteria bacterium CG17_big_fil_post_rev_8_21_14_2_50_48_13]|nr:MAG: transcription termination/antitermination protein NusA [Candidatus Gracilibacteria bacterium CG17_big_fil_post_rev_8_21_14_2_50_48_13]